MEDIYTSIFTGVMVTLIVAFIIWLIKLDPIKQKWEKHKKSKTCFDFVESEKMDISKTEEREPIMKIK